MASCALKLLAEGRAAEAVPFACKSAASALGEGYFESNMLAAATLAKAGDFRGSLEYWDKIARSAPHKLKYLTAAIRSAWQMEAEYPEAGARSSEWIRIFDHVFSACPEPRFLRELERRGWQGVGSTGVQEGRLKGWLWLRHGESPLVRIEGPKKVVFEFAMRPLKRDNEKILYEIDCELPDADCVISVSLDEGKTPVGSPVAVSSAVGAMRRSTNPKPCVIIPVYGDREATLACIGSVLASRKKNRTEFDIVVAWDHGPDPRLLADLRRLAKKGRLLLLESGANLGFIASVNAALRHCGGDAILLNADTLVHGDWVDRMLAAGKKPDAATVTALGNEAELMSYPSHGDRGEVAGLGDVRLYDQAAAALGPEAILEVPVGVGFCMLITSRAIKRIGGLDGRRLFRGYGEEVDYCLRASAAGLKNYGLFNVFVGHLGGRSFGPAKKALAAQNNETIFASFPKYRRAYEIFLAHAAGRRLRERLSKALLGKAGTFARLEIRDWSCRYLPPWARDEAHKPDRKGAVLFLKQGEGSQALLRIWTEPQIAEMNFHLPEETRDLRQALCDLGIRSYLNMTGRDVAGALFEITGKELPIDAPGSAREEQFTANARLKTIISAPPASMQGWKRLKSLGREMPEASFYIFFIDSLWSGMPLPANMATMPLLLDYRPLRPDAFIMPDNFFDGAAWREWLGSHGCADLPVYRLGSDD